MIWHLELLFQVVGQRFLHRLLLVLVVLHLLFPHFCDFRHILAAHFQRRSEFRLEGFPLPLLHPRLLGCEVDEIVGTAVAARVHLVVLFLVGSEQSFAGFDGALGLLLRHVGHVDFVRDFLVHENIGVGELDALVEEFELDVEDGGEVGEGFAAVDVLLEAFGLAVVDEEGSHEGDEDDIDDGVEFEGFIDGDDLFGYQIHELVDDAFELGVGEGGFGVGLWKKDGEFVVEDELLHVFDALVGSGVFGVLADAEVLVVEDAFIGVGVILEDLDDAVGVDEMVFEEIGEGLSVGENLLDAVPPERPQLLPLRQEIFHVFNFYFSL